MLYFGLIDEKISTSDKDLPVHIGVFLYFHTLPFKKTNKMRINSYSFCRFWKRLRKINKRGKMFWKIVNVWFHHNDFSSNFSCISEEQRLFVVKNKTGKRQGKRCKRKLTIYKDFCASLEAVFLTQGSVPHSASKRSSIVVFGRHHIQNGSGGLVFILSPRIRFFL